MGGAFVRKDRVPLGISVSARFARDDARLQLGESRSRLFVRQKKHHLRRAFVLGAVQGRGFQTEIAEVTGALKDAPLLASHLVDHAVEPVELGVQHRAHELRRPGAVAGEWLDAVAPALPIKSAGVDGAARLLGELWVAGRKAAAFAAGDVLVVVEAEGAGVADRAQFPAFVRAAHAQTAIFANLEITFS